MPTLSDSAVEGEPSITLSSYLVVFVILAVIGYIAAWILTGVIQVAIRLFGSWDSMGLSDAQQTGILLAVEVAALVTGYICYRYEKRMAPQRHKEKVRRAFEASLKQANFEALEVTRRVLDAATSYQNTSSAMTHLLRQAEDALEKAKTGYQERIYLSFWDNVEVCIEALTRFNELITTMRKVACDHAELLGGRTHDFPPLAVFSMDTPGPLAILGELTQTVRLAQRNFRFAVLWEQRVMRETLIEEFSKRKKADTRWRTPIDRTLMDLSSSLLLSLDSIGQGSEVAVVIGSEAEQAPNPGLAADGQGRH